MSNSRKYLIQPGVDISWANDLMAEGELDQALKNFNDLQDRNKELFIRVRSAHVPCIDDQKKKTSSIEGIIWIKQNARGEYDVTMYQENIDTTQRTEVFVTDFPPNFEKALTLKFPDTRIHFNKTSLDQRPFNNLSNFVFNNGGEKINAAFPPGKTELSTYVQAQQMRTGASLAGRLFLLWATIVSGAALMGIYLFPFGLIGSAAALAVGIWGTVKMVRNHRSATAEARTAQTRLDELQREVEDNDLGVRNQAGMHRVMGVENMTTASHAIQPVAAPVTTTVTVQAEAEHALEPENKNHTERTPLLKK